MVAVLLGTRTAALRPLFVDQAAAGRRGLNLFSPQPAFVDFT